MTEYVHDQQRWHGQLPDPVNAVMNEYIERSGVSEQAGDKLEVAEPPKLGENNFHQWEDAILTQLCAKKGNNNVPLAYVVRKPTPPQCMQMKLKGSSMKPLGPDLHGRRTRRQSGTSSSDYWHKLQ